MMTISTKSKTAEVSVARAPLVRSLFNYDRDAASRACGLVCAEDGRTKQSFKDECDINEIVRRFGLNGVLPNSVRVPQYGDYAEVSDFQSAMAVVLDAQSAFRSLPARVRSRFDNDPASFLDFVSDEANRAEAESLGLLVKPEGVVEVREPSRASKAPEAANKAVAPSEGKGG